mmetsp:Transcript_24197/g.21295  ORF Transcript_24197/g.21295 Transcript_24197/m.21295 type:complete len:437 (+) Transcript_24197:1256-2566(+)
MRKGIVYEVEVTVEEQANGLTLTPEGSFLTFEPESVTFDGYSSDTTIVRVAVSSDVPDGTYTIKWQKTESGSTTSYLEVEDSVINVVSDMAGLPKPKVLVEDFKFVWTGNYARDVFVTLTNDPATSVTLIINLAAEDSLLQGSVDNVIYNNFPLTLTFEKGETVKPFYVYAEGGAKDNTFIYALEGPSASVYDENIPDNSFIVRQESEQNAFAIISQITNSINENEAQMTVTLSAIGTLYYVAFPTSDVAVKTSGIINGHIDNINDDWIRWNKFDIEKIGSSNAYSKTITIDGLISQTKYSVYFVARSAFGRYSSMLYNTFTTLAATPGVNILIPTLQEVDTDELKQALSLTLSINPDRIYFKQSETYSEGSGSEFFGTDVNGYTFIIAPSPTDNSPTPQEIAELMLTSDKKTKFQTYIPSFFARAGVRITEVRDI